MFERFQKLMNELGVQLTETQIKQFDIYYRELVEWNKKINLTAITDLEGVYIKHFYDSVCMTKAIKLSNQSILDVGSGAGFPSIPLKIIYPNIQVTIVDSLNKRIKFLEDLTSKLNVEATLIHGRAEEMRNKNHYDIVTARAVANLNVLGELCIPFVKEGGYFISLKGRKYNEEIKTCTRMFQMLNSELEDTVVYTIDGDQRALLKIKKVKKSKEKYPRRFSQIKSNPL